MHFHVGLLGDDGSGLGGMSPEYRKSLAYKTFLYFAGIAEDAVSDKLLREKTLETIRASAVGKVVCLALDPVYDIAGMRQTGQSNLWVDNRYILELRDHLPDRILFGASVHPYDPDFRTRVHLCVENGAVLLKWLPSAQHINLADDRVREALIFLATAGAGGKPLPLLLHVGPEYAIMSTDSRSGSYDYLTWSAWDGFVNFWRFHKRWYVPDVSAIRRTIEAGLQAGAVIIFAHCGLPYFFSGPMGRLLEHSDFPEVREYLRNSDRGLYAGGCYADVSAFATPFRKRYAQALRDLPQEYLLMGSDFPTPIFDTAPDARAVNRAFRSFMRTGDVRYLVVPQENLLDVNVREIEGLLGKGSPVFTNFARLLGREGWARLIR